MTAKLGAAGGTGAKFSPLEVGWAHAYWPGGPAFRGEGYTDGQALNVGEPIPDEAGTSDLNADAGAAETELTYVASSNVNSQPAIRGADTSGDHPYYSSGVFPTYLGDDGSQFYASSTGWSVVAIWNQGSMLNAGSFAMIMRERTSASRFSIYAKSNSDLVVSVAGSSAVRSGWTAGDTIAVLAKGTDVMRYVDVDGTNYLNTSGATARSLSGLDFFMNGATSWPFSGDLAFIGLYEGDCTSDPAWSDFETWAADELGATV